MSVRPNGLSPEDDDGDLDLELLDPDEAEEVIPRINIEPIRTVVRELTRPDGSTITVEVPVYPPFELKDLQKSPNGKPVPSTKRASSK